MIDNKKVHSTRRKGIERVIQRKGDLEVGQGGKMRNAPEQQARWRRESHTPKAG